MFRVVADQLRISDGWVRCGHCAEVFDARLNMPSDPSQPPAAVRESIATTSAPSPASSAQVQAAAPAAPVVVTIEVAPAQGLADVMREVAADASSPAAVALVLTSKPALSDSAPPSRGAREIPHQASFLREARRGAFWRRPAVRFGLGLLALLLLVTLAFQVALDQRDRLAAVAPLSKPWLELACLPLACKVQAMRRIESLVIDGSSFNKLAPNVYRLGFSVRNLGRLDTALPAFELTLTNAQDQALLRRVFKPQELGAFATTLKAGGGWSGNVLVRLSLASGEVVGYRILAFYP